MCVSLTPALPYTSLSPPSLSLYGWTYTRGRACVGHFSKLPFRVPALYKDDMFFSNSFLQATALAFGGQDYCFCYDYYYGGVEGAGGYITRGGDKRTYLR